MRIPLDADNEAIMKELTRYEKIEMWALGIVAPACVLLWVISMLFQGESVFPGRHELIYFYGSHSYLVSALWFGISLGFITRYLLRYRYFNNKEKTLNVNYCLSLALIVTGLVSSIWITFSA